MTATGTVAVTGALTANAAVTLGAVSGDVITVKGTVRRRVCFRVIGLAARWCVIMQGDRADDTCACVLVCIHCPSASADDSG